MADRNKYTDVDITISNTKRNLLGKYYKIKRKYLQLYLMSLCTN